MRIVITGSEGFLGKHLMAKLRSLGYDPYGVSHKAYDLCNQYHINSLFDHVGKVDIMFHLAAKVGGIEYNLNNGASIYHDNVMMNTQLIHTCLVKGVDKFIMVGSVCSYPKHSPVPTSEHNLFKGYPEESNGAYGMSKLMALVQLQEYHRQYGLNFTYPVLANLYGPGDKSDHVISNLIKKFHSAEGKVTVWGTGKPSRDFLYVEDAAGALCKFIDVSYCEPINIATGNSISIMRLVELIAELTGFGGVIEFDSSKPGGQMVRCYDIHLAHDVLGWQAKTSIKVGLAKTMEWYATTSDDIG